MKGPESVDRGAVSAAASGHGLSTFRYIFNSVTAIAAVIVIFVVNTMGVVRTVQVLVGSEDTPRDYGYHSFNMPFLLREAALDASGVRAKVQAMLHAGNQVSYLERDGAGDAVLYAGGCSVAVNATTDRIYKPAYVSFLLHSMLEEYGGQANVLDNSTIAIVDCSFEGRHAQDTTAFKAYLLAANLGWLVTFQLQTVMANIPTRRDTMPTGTVTITNMSLASLVATPALPPTDPLAGLSSSGEAVHRMFTSRGFPFNNATFDEVYINDTTATGAWDTFVMSTQLEMILQGYGGMYRGSQNEQANYNTFVWHLSPNHLEAIYYFNYQGVGRIKNSWAWGEALVSGYLSFTIVASTIMACIISKNMYSATSEWWTPDLSPSIGSGVVFRGIMTILAWWIDGWWALQEWSYNQGNKRNNLLDMYVLTDSVKSDCLSLFLAGSALVASAFRLRVNPAVPVIIFIVVHSQRTAIVGALGFILHRANVDLIANQMLNVVRSDSPGLDMWMWHETLDFNATVVCNEMSWLFLALIIFGFYCFLARTSAARTPQQPVESAQPRTATFETGGTGAAPTLSGPMNALTCFEASTGEYLRRKFGLMTGHESYRVVKGGVLPLEVLYVCVGIRYASPSGIWTSGWVIVDNRFLFRTDDIMKVFFNIILFHDIFRAHCHVITEGKVDKTVIRVFRRDITVKQLFTLSLRPLA
ncbi:hypothetical protein ACHHYP_07027 [Achlya hypogyna]|uniref:Transmembrane protein n=1 Tax=Achlya hypogyna TaxID=1202772 RepID=A0A1V9YRN5_ACHHY|nr:hypothetical protein ACHHYP_07027 [Achlya hypogyna]